MSEQDAQKSDRWPLEADRIGVKLPMIEALCILAGHYGRRTSPEALTAGLPIKGRSISPSIFIRAAERADLHARISERSIETLKSAPNLPCVLVLNKQQSCILWEVDEDGQFHTQFPETIDEKTVLSQEQVEELYSGYAFFVRPVARSDERAGPAAIDNSRDWFWGTLKSNMKIYKDVALAAVMINIFALASPLFIMNVYDRVIPNNALSTLWVLAAGVLIVFAFDFLLKTLRAHFLDVAGRRADVKISAQLFEQVLGMTMADRPASAGMLASHMREFEGLRDFFTSATIVGLVDLPFLFLFVVLMFVIGGPIAFIPLLAIPVVLGIGFAMQKPMQRVIRESMNESAMKNSHLFETITGLETIKVQAAEGHTQRMWEELTDRASRTAIKSRRLSALGLHLTQFVQQITSVLIVIVGVFLIAEGDITMGALIGCVILSGRAMAPLAQVASILIKFNQSREALQQLDVLMKREVERPRDRHFISCPDIVGHVSFKDVVFHYPSQTMPALDNFSFEIEAGQHIGVIGAVGSGKTTIERLLLNLYQPDSGSVQIDNTDVRQIEPGDLRRAIGTVQQTPQLFYGSVRENITMRDETVDDRAVVRAAELAGVMDFLADTRYGLDTQVGERGEALSGGQRQAIAVARALLYDLPIIILDEPTAAMDPASEARLKQRMSRLFEQKTLILITHKGPMLSLVDKIMLIDRGHLVDFGPKDDVIKKLQARQYGTQAERTEV